jgi:membrane associated rhomboid family serine protease
MMCGAPSGLAAPEEVVPHPVVDHERLRFIRTVISRPAIFTLVFLVTCVFLYLLMELSGGASGQVLIEYGAKVNQRIHEGEWWRFVTPVFLHVTVPGLGPLHLIINMYGLFMLGPYVEKLYGSAKFVFFWIATGVSGVVVSYLTVRPELAKSTLGSFLFKALDAPAAGASTALFGLVGVLFVFGIKYRRELPEDFKRAFGFGMLPMIVLNLFIGYIAREMVDNAGHLGGLVSGVILAIFVGYRRPGEDERTQLFWRAVKVAMLALVVVSFFSAWRNFNGPRPDISRLPRRLFTSTSSSTYIEAMNASAAAFNSALDGDAGPSERIIKTLDEAPVLDEKERALRGELKTLLLSAQQFGTASQSGKNKQSPEQRNELVAAFSDWQNRYSEWIKTEGVNYGIVTKNGES